MRSTALNPYKPHRPDVEPPPNVYSDSVHQTHEPVSQSWLLRVPNLLHPSFDGILGWRAALQTRHSRESGNPSLPARYTSNGVDI